MRNGRNGGLQQDYGVGGVDLAQRISLGGCTEDSMVVGRVDGGCGTRGGFDLESRRRVSSGLWGE